MYRSTIKTQATKDLNIRQDTLKLLEENIGKTFSDINCTSVFLGQSPKAIEIKAKINKRDLIKLISFCTAKETIKKTEKTTYRLGENICKCCNQQGLNFQNIQTAHATQQQQKNTNNPIKKWSEDLNKHFSKEDIQMANRHMKR